MLKLKRRDLIVATLSALVVAAWFAGQPAAQGNKDSAVSGGQQTLKGWKKGRGFGWVWGKDDEVGALNALDESKTLDALKLATTGKVYDLGITYSRNSFKWPGHSPGEIMTFRSPPGETSQKDQPFLKEDVNPSLTRWHSCALFINDNVATQIDGLAHIVVGKDHHWYNGFKEADWGGDFGVRKCDATTIPPVVARAVMLDIAGLKKVRHLPAHYGITPEDVNAALTAQDVKLQAGDVVLFRTGTLSLWGNDGADHNIIGEADSAGITLETAKYLVEQFGSIMVGSDTSGLEVAPAPKGADSFIPVHKYLLVEQGVHIAEFHYLEDLAREKVYEFCYVGVTNKIKGSTAGFTMRPIAIR